MKKFSLEYLKETYESGVTLESVLKAASDLCDYAEDKSDEEIKEMLNNFSDFILYLGHEKNKWFFITHSRKSKLYTKVFGDVIIDTFLDDRTDKGIND